MPPPLLIEFKFFHFTANMYAFLIITNFIGTFLPKSFK